MINDFLSKEIRDCYPFEPTEEQNQAIDLLSRFAITRVGKPVFLLKGYAGTGKTTLVGTLVKVLKKHHGKIVLMAPTGRASKVLSQYSGTTAYTIHKKIYRQKSIVDTELFQLDRNMHENTIFLVDESSMISNAGLSGLNFGTGRLLDDLIRYVYSGKGCSMLLVGDSAQLPPVGEIQSPAMDEPNLRTYGLDVTSFTLRNVVRQVHDSGILHNATALRNMNIDGASVSVPDTFVFKLSGFTDVCRITGDQLIDCISQCYHNDGIDQTMVLCRSNKRAIVYNNGIRRTILDREDEICRGEYLMIVKNNYYWTEKMAQDPDRDSYIELPSFIANGDIAVIQRVRRNRELYGFRFADAVLSFPDYDDLEFDATIMLDTLYSESPSLTRDENERLFQTVMLDYEDIRSKRKKMMELRENPHYNALQVKYAYAITCHKAQGGQWKNVFIDQGFVPEDGRNNEYYRWLYTALTRSTGRVYLVNWPEKELQ